MKKLNFIIALTLLAYVVTGQEKLNIKVAYTDNAPTIDGIEEEIWDMVPEVILDSAYLGENPTVDAYWKALWDDNALYVLLNVKDDDHWPFWEKAGAQWFNYDQAEVYLDVNEVLEDGKSPNSARSSGPDGHYQVHVDFVDGGSGVVGSLVTANERPGGSYCYVITGEDYVFEYALGYTSFANIDGEIMSAGSFSELEKIGFDVYIIDQDEGVTTDRQRAVWHNTGRIDQNFANMDDAGTITLVYLEPSSNVETNTNTFSVYPNPVFDILIINAEFDKLIITNILGEEIETIVNSDNRINMNSFARGIYLIQAFNKGDLLGVTKIHKM